MRSDTFHEKWRTLLGLCLGVLAGAQCSVGVPRSDSRLHVRFRFIKDPPQTVARREFLFVSKPVFDWRAAGKDGLPLWPSDVQRWEVSGARAQVERRPDRVNVIRRVDFDAGSVSRVEVVLASDTAQEAAVGDVAIYWADREGGFSSRRMMVGTAVAGGSPEMRRFVFAVSADENWGSDLKFLRVTVVRPGTESAGRLWLRAVRGYAETPDIHALRMLAAKGFAARFDGQIRNVLPALPDVSIERSFVARETDRLSLEFGGSAGILRAFEFEVGVQAGGSEPEWFKVSAPEGGASWGSFVLPLSQWKGQRVRILLRSRALTEWEYGRGLPVWSAPEVLGRGPDA